MRGIIKKLSVFFIGVFSLLLLLEIGLRVIGAINTEKSGDLIAAGKYSDSHIILCLGDSWTAGEGAPEDKSYPAQLQVLLNSLPAKKKIKVLNLGAGANNTTQFIDTLNNALKKNIKPKLLILLGGDANFWNYWGYHAYLKGNNFRAFMEDYLYRIRVYKLAKLLLMNITEKIRNNAYLHKQDDPVTGVGQRNILFFPKSVNCEKGWNYFQQGKYNESRDSFRRGIELDPKDVECYKGLGAVYLAQGQDEQAEEWFKKGVEISPADFSYCASIARLYRQQNQITQATNWYKQAIRINPQDNESISGWYLIQKNYEDKLTFLEELEKKGLLTDNFADILKKIKGNNKKDIEDGIKRWVAFDIEKIIKICRENKIKIILQNYPKNVYRQKEAGEILRYVASINSLPFVDNFQAFIELKREKGNIEDYFTPDGGHPNAKGYALMAENIFNKIGQDKIFGQGN